MLTQWPVRIVATLRHVRVYASALYIAESYSWLSDDESDDEEDNDDFEPEVLRAGDATDTFEACYLDTSTIDIDTYMADSWTDDEVACKVDLISMILSRRWKELRIFSEPVYLRPRYVRKIQARIDAVSEAIEAIEGVEEDELRSTKLRLQLLCFPTRERIGNGEDHKAHLQEILRKHDPRLHEQDCADTLKWWREHPKVVVPNPGTDEDHDYMLQCRVKKCKVLPWYEFLGEVGTETTSGRRFQSRSRRHDWDYIVERRWVTEGCFEDL